MTEPTALYRHFDAEGRLLYVGIARSITARLAQHADSPWDDQIATITVERFATRAEAEAAERAAIKTEKPTHNRALNGRRLGPAEVPPGEYSLAAYLEAARISQIEFAEMLGTSSANVSRWSNGVVPPNTKHIIRINQITEGRVPPGVWFKAKGDAQ